MAFLSAFEQVFTGQIYRHRSSTIGDRLCLDVFEDLYHLGRASSFVQRVDTRNVVVSTTNRVTGKPARRGDGTLGEHVVGSEVQALPGFAVARGATADVQIGVEVKILATAMIKQIDRVIGDLRKQAVSFRAVTPDAITVGIVGVNTAPTYRSYEGMDRFYDKPGATGVAPASEARDAVLRLRDGTRGAEGAFDELLIVEFEASNVEPFPFSWPRRQHTADAYSAALQRISREYERRF